MSLLPVCCAGRLTVAPAFIRLCDEAVVTGGYAFLAARTPAREGA
jgi:hypothetical protein